VGEERKLGTRREREGTYRQKVRGREEG
jgi:hypothetical protein